MYECVYACIYVCVCICVYVWMYVCMCVYLCMCVCFPIPSDMLFSFCCCSWLPLCRCPGSLSISFSNDSVIWGLESPHVLVWFVLQWQNTLTKVTWGGKGLFGFHFYITVRPWEESQELEAGAWRQELKQSPWRIPAYWLAHHDFFSLLFNVTQDHLPRGSSVHRESNPPSSVINKKVSRRHSYRTIWLGTSQIMFPLPRVTLVHAKICNYPPHTNFYVLAFLLHSGIRALPAVRCSPEHASSSWAGVTLFIFYLTEPFVLCVQVSSVLKTIILMCFVSSKKVSGWSENSFCYSMSTANSK